MKKVLSILVALAILATMSAFVMTASAEETAALNAKYKLPVDDVDSWIAENMEPYAWSLPLAEGCDTIDGEVTSEGYMQLTFPEDGYGYTYPHARVESAAGLVQTVESDYINLKASLAATEEDDIRWSVILVNVEGTVNLAQAIGDACGVETLNEGHQLPGGDYDATFKIADALKAWDEKEGTDYYEGMYGAGGNSYITGFRFYIYSDSMPTDKPLTIKELTVGSMEGEEDTTSSDAGTSSAASTTSSSASGTSSVTSKVSSISSNTSNLDSDPDSNPIVPIIIAAAVILVAAAVVVVIIVVQKKKKNNNDDNKDGKDNA